MDEWAADNVRAAAAAAAAAVAARVHRWQEAALQHARRAGQWQGRARKAGWRHPCQPTLDAAGGDTLSGCSAAGDVTGKAACTHVALANRDFRGWASRRG